MTKTLSLQLPTRKSKSSDDNMIPLINIVFLLLIFFMIAGNIAGFSDASIELPSSNLAQKATTETLNLSLTTDERFYLNGTEVSYEQLVAEIDQLDAHTSPIVSISADKRMQVTQLYRVLSLFSDVAGASVSLRTLSEVDTAIPVAGTR